MDHLEYYKHIARTTSGCTPVSGLTHSNANYTDSQVGVYYEDTITIIGYVDPAFNNIATSIPPSGAWLNVVKISDNQWVLSGTPTEENTTNIDIYGYTCDGIVYNLGPYDLHPSAAAPTLTTFATGIPSARGVAIDGGYAYVVGVGGTVGLYKIDLSTSAVSLFAAVPVANGALDTDGTYAYLGASGSNLMRVHLGTGAVSTFATSLGVITGVAVHGGFAYLSDFSGQRIVKVDLSTAATTTFATGLPQAFGIAIDGTHVYSSGNGKIYKIDLGTGTPVLLSTGTGNVPALSYYNGVLYASRTWFSRIDSIDTSTGTMTLFITTPSAAQGIDVTAGYALYTRDNQVDKITYAF